jgi:5-carboxymethyl-2-hydroxymuconate isomerase
MGIKERLRRLEEGQGDDFQGTLDFLTLMYKIEHGRPPSVETMRELERQAREMVAERNGLSVAQLLKRVDGRGLPRPGGTR